MFCGDEVAAIVVDIGSSVSKFGSAGEDTPRHVFRSEIGHCNSKVYLDAAIRPTPERIEIKKLISNEILDWEVAESLIQHGIDHMRLNSPQQHPILFAESHFKSTQDKIKLVEYTFETLGAPGIYMSPNAVLSSFSVGKPSSVVVDFGSSKTHVSVVSDGYELRKSRTSTLRGGDWMDRQINHVISRSGVTLRPLFELNPKTRFDTTQSFRELHLGDTIRDIKRWMCFIPSQTALTFRTEYMNNVHIPPYFLPDGSKVGKGSNHSCVH